MCRASHFLEGSGNLRAERARPGELLVLGMVLGNLENKVPCFMEPEKPGIGVCVVPGTRVTIRNMPEYIQQRFQLKLIEEGVFENDIDDEGNHVDVLKVKGHKISLKAFVVHGISVTILEVPRREVSDVKPKPRPVAEIIHDPGEFDGVPSSLKGDLVFVG